MSTSLDDYTALNEQLAALVEAGVPLDVGLGHPDQPAAQALEKIRATVLRRVNRGESISEALEGDDQDVPPSYRSLVQLGLHAGNLSAAFDDSNLVAESVVNSRQALHGALIYPLVLALLVYVGLIGLCLYFVPVLEGMYESLEVAPNVGLRVMQAVRGALPYWGVGLPMLVLLFFTWRLISTRPRDASGDWALGLMGWLPGVSKTVLQLRCARFAGSLGQLLEEGTPLDQSLRIAADGCRDRKLREAARLLTSKLEDGKFSAKDETIARRFPPFLRWALWWSEPTTGRAHALKIAAHLYQDMADRRAQRLRAVMPFVALVLVGGTVTLLYALAVFLPFLELIYTLSG